MMLIIRNIDQDRTENINPKSLQPGSHPQSLLARQTGGEESQDWSDCPRDDCSAHLPMPGCLVTPLGACFVFMFGTIRILSNCQI